MHLIHLITLEIQFCKGWGTHYIAVLWLRRILLLKYVQLAPQISGPKLINSIEGISITHAKSREIIKTTMESFDLNDICDY